jgi:predicted ATPase with chaperone activity
MKTDPNGSGGKAGDNGSTQKVSAGVCTCTAPQIRRYLSRISGPLLDKVDIHIEMEHKGAPASRYSRRKGENSEDVRARVVKARLRQGARPGRVHQLNARLKGKRLRDACPLDAGAQGYLDAAVEQFSLSRSRLESMLRVARTIADLEGSDGIETHHIEEAINYRPHLSTLTDTVLALNIVWADRVRADQGYSVRFMQRGMQRHGLALEA